MFSPRWSIVRSQKISALSRWAHQRTCMETARQNWVPNRLLLILAPGFLKWKAALASCLDCMIMSLTECLGPRQKIQRGPSNCPGKQNEKQWWLQISMHSDSGTPPWQLLFAGRQHCPCEALANDVKVSRVHGLSQPNQSLTVAMRWSPSLSFPPSHPCWWASSSLRRPLAGASETLAGPATRSLKTKRLVKPWFLNSPSLISRANQLSEGLDLALIKFLAWWLLFADMSWSCHIELASASIRPPGEGWRQTGGSWKNLNSLAIDLGIPLTLNTKDENQRCQMVPAAPQMSSRFLRRSSHEMTWTSSSTTKCVGTLKLARLHQGQRCPPLFELRWLCFMFIMAFPVDMSMPMMMTFIILAASAQPLAHFQSWLPTWRPSRSRRCFGQQIYSRCKAYEIRPPHKKFENLEDKEIRFHHWYTRERLVAKVKGLMRFDSVYEALLRLGVDRILPRATLQSALESCLQKVARNGICQ